MFNCYPVAHVFINVLQLNAYILYAKCSSQVLGGHFEFLAILSIIIILKKIGVLRDTARAPQPPANPSTGHQISQQWSEMPISG